jgi:glutathione-specific gamma-glutamylcyclotransferase
MADSSHPVDGLRSTAMSLTRADLEQGLMRRLWRESDLGYRALSEEELDASADATLDACPTDDDPWVFAYGSLIWNPLLEYEERQPVTLHGFHRRFCLWSKTGRGTPQRPGLVLGLDRGGCCPGVAYRIPRAKARAELRLLWRREMVAGSYTPRWLTVRSDDAEYEAIAFVINRKHPSYAGKLGMDQMVEAISSASGRLGTSREYLCQTIDGLLAHGLTDPFLVELAARVNAVAALGYPTAGDEGD